MTTPATINSADEKKVRDAKKRANFTEKKRLDRWRKLIATADGRSVLAEILAFTGLHNQGFLPGDQAQYRDGMQNVGAMIEANALKAQPDGLALIWSQHDHEKKNGY